MSRDDVVAYALRSQHEGTVDVELEDGSTEQRPKFGGAVLSIGGHTFDLGEHLEAGDGVVVVHQSDDLLRDVLDAVPVLKTVQVPKGAEPVSKYERLPTDDLRHTGSLRDIRGSGGMSRADLIGSLEAYDRAAADHDLAAITAVQEAGADFEDVEPEPEPEPSQPPDEPTLPAVDSLTNGQLAAVLDNDHERFEHAGAIEVPAALDELQRRASEGDPDAKAALVERGQGGDA